MRAGRGKKTTPEGDDLVTRKKIVSGKGRVTRSGNGYAQSTISMVFGFFSEAMTV